MQLSHAGLRTTKLWANKLVLLKQLTTMEKKEKKEREEEEEGGKGDEGKREKWLEQI